MREGQLRHRYSVAAGGLPIVLNSFRRLRDAATIYGVDPWFLTQVIDGDTETGKLIAFCSEHCHVVGKAASYLCELGLLFCLSFADLLFSQKQDLKGCTVVICHTAIINWASAFSPSFWLPPGCYHDQHSYNAIEQNLFQIKDHLVDVRETQNRQAIALDEQTEAMKHLMEFMTGNARVLRTVEALNAPLNDLAGADIRTFRLALLAPKADKEERVAACKTLLRRLDYDLAATSADLLDMYKIGPTMNRDDQERSVHVTRSEQLAAWVSAPHSTALLVNGGSQAAMRCSAMSFVCARMAAALLHMRSQAKPDVVPLYYFCGQHIASGSRGGYQDTVSDVANSLLAQLVTICGETDEEAGVDVRPAIALGKVKHDDVKSVLRRFRAVVQQLPADTIVLCIVDGLSFYLDAQRTEAAAEQLLHGLLRLSRDRKSRKSKPTCTFKLLVTAPYRFNPHVASEIAEEETLNVPLRLPLSGGFNEMKWHLSIGQLLDETSESE